MGSPWALGVGAGWKSGVEGEGLEEEGLLGVEERVGQGWELFATRRADTRAQDLLLTTSLPPTRFGPYFIEPVIAGPSSRSLLPFPLTPNTSQVSTPRTSPSSQPWT